MDNKEKLLQKLFLSTESKGVIDEDNRTLVGVVGSDGIIDRHGESINPMGWELANYLKNPVILWAHDYAGFPIGKAVRVWIEDGKLMFNVKFAETEEAEKAFNLYKGGFLNSFSVGFIPKEYDTSGEYTYAKQELLELSAVPVPANPNARLNGMTVSEVIKSIDMGLKKEEEETTDPKEEEPKKEPEAEEPKTEPKEEEPKTEPEAEPDKLDEKEELRTMIKEIIMEALKEVTIIKEVEKVVEVKTNETQDMKEIEEWRDMLRSMNKGSSKTLHKLNRLLEITDNQKGGEIKNE